MEGSCNMSYDHLLKFANIINSKFRLIEYASYYKEVKLKGLHYVNFIPSSNTLSISNPNHTTHHESTSYLISKKESYSINTVRGQAHDIKKFLDFLLIWEIDLLNCDLYIILQGFIDYMRCISTSNSKFFNKSIYWSSVKEVPLHKKAYSLGQIERIEYSRDGFMERQEWNEFQYSGISKALSTTIQYIYFLKEHTIHYHNLPLTQIPMKVKYETTMLSGTLGKKLVSFVDIQSMLKITGLKPVISKQNLCLDQKVFTIDEIDMFMNSLSPRNHQNLLLFYVLKCFGLRAAEAANLMIYLTTIPDNLIFMEHFEAKEKIKNQLKGDIEFSSTINRWVCYVIERDNEDYRSQHKSGSRQIPFLFSEELLLELLVNALKERQILIRYAKEKHNYLFVSRHNTDKGNPINGKTISTRYSYYSQKLFKKSNIDLTQYSPHSFRHFFASYLLRIVKEDISDVSRWLGHSDIEITRDTYSHYLPNQERDKKIVEDMAKSLK
jgi:integrase